MYTLSPYQFVSKSCPTEVVSLLRDDTGWEEFNEQDLYTHFNNIHTLFLQRIATLSSDFNSVSLYEEKELHFMLDALIQSKRLLQDVRENER